MDSDKLILSVISRIELLTGIRPGEDNAIKQLLEMFREIDVTIPIAEIAGKYMNKYYKSHSLNTANAIIAATAKLNNAVLYTLNIKHFPMDDIEIVKPY